MNNPDYIVHLCSHSDWQAALQQGSYQAESLAQTGFIHFSMPDQILQTANAFYHGLSDPVLLWVAIGRLQAELRWDQTDDGVFPHLYGSLNLDAVDFITGLLADPDGVYRTVSKPE